MDFEQKRPLISQAVTLSSPPDLLIINMLYFNNWFPLFQNRIVGVSRQDKP